MPNPGRRVPPRDLIFYHWSPRDRKKSIIRHGFRVGSWSIDRLWRPPHNCFADDVWLAWHLSGRYYPDIPAWDLWQVYADNLDGWECITDTRDDGRSTYVKEYRVYHNIPKRHVTWVAERLVAS